MNEAKSGGCLCGRVRYEVRGAALIGGACYCRDCQRTSGGEAVHGQMFPAASIRVQGETRRHTLTAASGNDVHRDFCPDCGTHVFSQNSAAPEMRAIRVGTLDDPSGYRSEGSVWVSSAQPWHRPDPDRPQHPTMPCMADLAGTSGG